MSKIFLGLVFLAMAVPATAEQLVSDKGGHYYNNPDSPYYQKHRPVLFEDQKDEYSDSVHYKMRRQRAQ